MFAALPVSASDPSSAQRDSYVPDPEPFSGDLSRCRGFLLQCRHVFLQRPATFSSDKSKVLYVIGLLRGRALDWAEAAESRCSFLSTSYVSFEANFKSVSGWENHLHNKPCN
uniref:DUF4939 domain-containing protein n=1 Tax=Oryzias melastigma TaxID=30732 RepID=A0A3B3DMB5_ORYME